MAYKTWTELKTSSCILLKSVYAAAYMQLLSLIKFLTSALPFAFFLHLYLHFFLFWTLIFILQPPLCSLLLSTKGLWNLSVKSNLHNVLSQTGVKSGTTVDGKIFESRICFFFASWLAMSLCSYSRKSSLTLSFSDIPHLDLNSQYISQHSLFRNSTQKTTLE